MIVGLLEYLMTATTAEEMTDTKSDKNRECTGQGVANIANGFSGGMAGCAVIGESVINVKAGGRERLSTLDNVMIVVSIGAFNWASSRNPCEHPKSSTSSCWRRWRETASGRWKTSCPGVNPGCSSRRTRQLTSASVSAG